jgi:hypothetical protein
MCGGAGGEAGSAMGNAIRAAVDQGVLTPRQNTDFSLMNTALPQAPVPALARLPMAPGFQGARTPAQVVMPTMPTLPVGTDLRLLQAPTNWLPGMGASPTAGEMNPMGALLLNLMSRY